MDIIIKVLQGEESTIKVDSYTTILELKHAIETSLQIPVAYQKLLHCGRTLIDDKTIEFYSTIKSGSRLTLVVKKPECLKDALHKFFRKYYNEQQSEKLTTEFMINFEKNMQSFSLDDIERMATSNFILQPASK